MTVQDTLQKLDTQEAAELMAELYGEAGAARENEGYPHWSVTVRW